MNEKLYQANVELVDENKVLKEDKKILQRRIDKAIEWIEENQYYFPRPDKLSKILKGDKINE